MLSTLPRIVVVGGGFGGLEAAFHVRQRVGRRAHLTLIAADDHFVFRPDLIYIPFGKPAARYQWPLRPALEKRQIVFIHDRAEAIDPKRRVVSCSHTQVPYDLLVLATGARAAPERVPGMSEHASLVWSLSDLEKLRGALETLIIAADAGEPERVLFLVPQGCRWAGPVYELCLMLDTHLRRTGDRERVSMTLATHETQLLEPFGPRMHESLACAMTERGIDFVTRARTQALGAGVAEFDGALPQQFDLCVAMPPIVAATRFDGLPQDADGFIHTHPSTLEVLDFEGVYAVGDASGFPAKLAHLALLGGHIAGERIAERVLHETPTAMFEPLAVFVLEQLDTATFVQAPLRETHEPACPVAPREARAELYRIGTAPIWRVGRKMVATSLSSRFRGGRPFHAGASWAVFEAGLRMMSTAFSD